MIKEKILFKIKKCILASNENISDVKLEEIMYGIEGIYLTLIKIIIILAISLLLHIFKETIFLLILFNIIRFVSFGAHTKDSTSCLILSLASFIGLAYLSKYVYLNFYIETILKIVLLTIIILYAPADTSKRPIISKKRRIIYKISSITITIIYFILTLIIKDNTIDNLLIFSILLESIMILPVTYKLLGVSYNNYKKY